MTVKGHTIHVSRLSKRAIQVMNGSYARGAVIATLDHDYSVAPCPHGYCLSSHQPYIIRVPSYIKEADIVEITLINTIEGTHPLAKYAEQRIERGDTIALVTYSGGKAYIDLIVKTVGSLRDLYALYGLIMSCDEEGLENLGWQYELT